MDDERSVDLSLPHSSDVEFLDSQSYQHDPTDHQRLNNQLLERSEDFGADIPSGGQLIVLPDDEEEEEPEHPATPPTQHAPHDFPDEHEEAEGVNEGPDDYIYYNQGVFKLYRGVWIFDNKF